MLVDKVFRCALWAGVEVRGHGNGGEDGIRTHVPGYPDHLISSQRRYDRFGTSPVLKMIHPFGLIQSQMGVINYNHAHTLCSN